MNYNSCHRIKLSLWVQRNLESRRGKCYLLEFLDLWKTNPNIHHIPMLLLIAFTHIPLHNTTDTMLWGTDRCDQSVTSITSLRIIKSHEIFCTILHSSLVAWLATITAADPNTGKGCSLLIQWDMVATDSNKIIDSVYHICILLFTHI